MKRIYTYLAARLVRAIVAWCTARKRYVDYVHQTGAHVVTVDVSPEGMRARANSVPETRVYMRRYVISGYMTGDVNHATMGTQLTDLRYFKFRAWPSIVLDLLRYRLPNLYLHHMHAPDADECLHDHPWPWGLSFVLLGGYTESRLEPPTGYDPRAIYVPGRTFSQRTHNAPALNWIPGSAFHRVAKLDQRSAYPQPPELYWDYNLIGTFTIFLAGPRRRNKAWGYLVPGRGYVNQKERHAELGASEVRP